MPAATQTIIAAGKQLSQAARYQYLSTNLAFKLPEILRSGKSSRSDNPVSQIRIFPGDLTINQGEQIVFSAVGFDSQEAAVTGIDFVWTAIGEESAASHFSLENGVFKPWLPGRYIVTADGAGLKSQVTVTVNPLENDTGQEGLRPSSPIGVSTRSGQKQAVNDSNLSEDTKKNSKDAGSLPSESEGLRSVDDPENLPGNPPGAPADGGASSGNFRLSAPVIVLPGRGNDLSLALNYNSRVWNKSGSTLTYDFDGGFPAPGWSLGFGKLKDMGANSGTLLIDSDGTRHPYSGTITQGPGSGTTFQGYTSDGKFIDYRSLRDSNGVYSATAWFPNGAYIEYGAKGAGSVYPTYIRDAQGNFITVTYRNNQGPEIETVTDTLGRVITFNYDSSTPARLLSITAPRMQNEAPSYGTGATRTLVRLHYKPLTLDYSFAGSITPIVSNATPQVLDAIYYPGTGTGYWFGDTDSYSSYGMLTKVMENRGMTWSQGATEQGDISPGQMTKQALYNYPLTPTNTSGRTNGIGLTDAPDYTSLSESWDGRDVNQDAVTTYAFDNATTKWDGTSISPARMVSVTQPNGVTNRQYSYRTPGAWTDGLVFYDETFVMENNSEVVISSSLVSWQQGDYQSPRPSWTQTTDEKGKNLKTVLDYSNGLFNQVTRSCDYDNSNVLLSCTNTVYENSQAYKGTWVSMNTGTETIWIFSGGRHIFNLVTMTNIENPDGTIASQTNYEFDNYQTTPMVNTPGVIRHDPSHDPYTTQTTQQQGPCINWYQPPYGSQVCTQYQIITVSLYQSATDKRGNVTKVTKYSDAGNPSGPTGAIHQTHSYDINGSLRTISTAASEQTSINYDISNYFAYPVSQTTGASDPNSPHRNATSSVYDIHSGLIKQETDADGRTSTIMYDPNNLRAVKSISSTGAYSTFGYDDQAMTVTEKVLDASNNVAGHSIRYLNGAGLLKREESLGANNVWDVIEIKYTKDGMEWKETIPYRTGDTPQWKEKVYDSQGRLVKIIEPNGSESQTFYNETQFPDSATTVSANTLPPGLTMRAVDAWGRERWGRYDQQGRLSELVEPNPDPTVNPTGSVFASGSLVTKYSYNTLGKLVKSEQGSQIREFKYDTLGRMTRQKLAEQTATLNDSGVYVGVNGSGAKWSEALWYDSRSNITQKTDARGVRTYLSYQIGGVEDPLNRLQSRVYDISGPLDTSQTITHAPSVSYGYMTTGDKTRPSYIRTDGFLLENFTYDSEGRLRDYSQTIDNRSATPMVTSYFADSLNRVDEVWYPAQYGVLGSPRKIVKKSYDVASRLSSLKVDGTEVAGNIVYNAADQTTSIKIGPSGSNQITESYTFDPQTGLLTGQRVTQSNQDILDLSYDYNRNNAVGSINGKTGHITAVTNNIDKKKNRYYEFDALGRLMKAKGGAGGYLWQQNYSYDRYGNRTQVTASGNAADNSPIPADGLSNLTHDPTSNRITTSGFQYDAAGNLTRGKAEDGTWLNYLYDAAGRLQVVKKDDGTYLQAFQYGSTNARLMDLDYVYGYVKMIASDGGVVLAEYTEYASTVMTWTKSNIYLGDNILSTITPNGAGGEAVEYHHPDHMGTRTVTDQANGTSYEQNTLPFGTALNAESTGSQSRRFTSYERSARTGLDYAVNRIYDSKLGRFTQVDPIGMNAVDAFDPQTLNLYSYCGNDPINHLDSDGLFFKKLFKWIGKVFKVLKWVAIVVAVAVAVAVTAVVFAPATSVIFKAAMWFLFKAMPVISKYLGWAIGGTSTSGLYRTPSINPSGGGWGLSAFPDGLTVEGGVLAVVTVNIKWYEKVGNFLEGFAETLTFGLPSAIDSWMGRTRDIDRNAPEYRAGEVVGTITSLVLPGGTALKGVKLAKRAKLGTKLFGRHKVGILNRNDYLRIGWSFERDLSILSPVTGRDVFRIAVGSKRSLIHWHLKLFPR